MLSAARTSATTARPTIGARTPPRAAVVARATATARASGEEAASAAPVAAPVAAAAASRRGALVAAAAAAAALGLGLGLRAGPARAADAAAADTCSYSTLDNGVQWCDLKVGEGPSPVAGAMIRAHYRGQLASNGKEFDSSYARGRPLSFPVGKGAVIRGWDLSILGDGTDALPAMKEGGKRRVVLPAALAYGDRGAGGVIPPGAALDFVIELMPKRRG